MNEALRRELLELIADDDRLRAELARDGSLFDGYHPRMAALHRRNVARLRALIELHGWPGRSLAGEDGAAAAWRIVQHAIGEPDFMRAGLVLLRDALQKGEADRVHVAMLEDRIRVFEGRPQLYGTQYDWDDEHKAMVPAIGIEAPEQVDERRRAIGLPPIEWRRPLPDDEPPPIQKRAERAAEMEAWARRTGWRINNA
jgi:hypothetical protein